MKKTIKSIFAIMLILCMVFTIAGCGKDNTESTPVAAGDDFFTDTRTENEVQQETASTDAASKDSGSSNGKEQSSNGNKTNQVGGKSWKEVLASMPKKLRNTTIVMYNWNKAAEYTGAPEVIQQFTKQTGINVEWNAITYETYFTKLPALIASGENIPDVVRTRGPVPNNMISYQPLSTANFDFSDAAWDKQLMDLYSVGDKAYATTLKNTHVGSVNLMFYNKALIQKHDLEDPYKLWKAGKWDWDKYIEMCRDFQELTGNAASSGEGWTMSYLSLYGIQGAVAFNGKQYFNNMHDNKFLTVHQMLGKLYNEDKLFVFGGRDNFDSELHLFSIGTSIHARKKNSYFGNLKSANSLYVVPMPSIPGQKTYYQGYSEAEAYAIAKGAKNPDAVPYFLRYFLDGANYELSTYFCNEQNLEVYNWCMNQENMIFVYDYPDDIKEVDNTGIMGQTSAQMKTFIDAHSGVVDKTVKEYNANLNKLK